MVARAGGSWSHNASISQWVDATAFGSADATTIAAVLGRAFFDDPVMRWVVPDDDRRRRIMPAFFQAHNTTLLGYGETYVAADDVGAVLWAPPGLPAVDPSDAEAFGRDMEALFGTDAPRLFEIVALLDEYHPQDRLHFHLQWAGVEPERQGQGIGSALLEPVLQRADRDGMPAYTEGTSMRNRRLYEREGFRLLSEIAPAGGPPLFRMWREPGAT